MSQAAAVVRVLQAVAETIREAETVPAETVYAALMSQGCTLQQFDRLIDTLIGAGLVSRSGTHLLKWVGPRS